MASVRSILVDIDACAAHHPALDQAVALATRCQAGFIKERRRRSSRTVRTCCVDEGSFRRGNIMPTPTISTRIGPYRTLVQFHQNGFDR